MSASRANRSWAGSVTTDDDDVARVILDEFYNLPDTGGYSVEELEDRLRERGLQIIANPAGTVTRVRHTSVGTEASGVPGQAMSV
jgi:hypothetical protein